MPDERHHPALARIVREHDAADVVDLLARRLPGADLTTLLLEVARRRAAATSGPQVLTQHHHDRFVRPGAVDPRRLLTIETTALDVLATRPDTPFDPVVVAPVVPFGTHAVAGIDQDRVVTTIRRTEVAADPTTSLALEAAARRQTLRSKDARSAEVVRLACTGRVLRAQRFAGPRSFAHFSLLGLVSAGRDRGRDVFDGEAFDEHLSAVTAVCRALGVDELRVRVTDLEGTRSALVERVLGMLAAEGVRGEAWPDRATGRGYYARLCFNLTATIAGEEIDIGDGGLVGWTASLLGDAKERLMISGLGLERLAMLLPAATER